ncbi:hypothetical protein B0H13DRAFT_317606 [Mycena leptocephala]|nr:hypothetical protein B0H13DRAFT_317606 [Mycena leptocephala]
MIPVSQVEKLHAGSALASYYFRNETSRHFYYADSYWEETTGDKLYRLPGTAWIRLSTGKLCMDVGHGYESCADTTPFMRSWVHLKLPEVKLTEYDLGDELLYTLELNEFYSLLGYGHSRFDTCASSTPESIPLPSICNSYDRAYSKSNGFCAIPTTKNFTPDDLYIDSWYTDGSPPEVLPTGWTRVDYLAEYHSYPLQIAVRLKDYIAPMKWWLSQQHYVRNHLQGAFNATELITGIYFFCILRTDLDLTLQGTFMADAPTDKVYLFLFTPQVDIVDNLLTVTNPPDTEKYYWAFDPAGLNRLTHGMAEDFGLPTVEFSIDLWGGKWDEHDYDMIREFHVAKGFDPYTQDVAIAMGYPLIDIEKMKKLSPRFADENSMDGSDAKVDDGIYYSLGLC